MALYASRPRGPRPSYARRRMPPVPPSPSSLSTATVKTERYPRRDDTERVDLLLQRHRAPLRALYCHLEACSRREAEGQASTGASYFGGYFADAASPLAWALLEREHLRPRSSVIARAAARWRGSESDGLARYLRGRFRSDTVPFEAFEAFFAGWARRSAGGLEVCLTALAEESCGVIEASLAASLHLKAPVWLLGRDEHVDINLDAVWKRAFRTLGTDNEWRCSDAYRFCRRAGLLGDALSPSFVLAAFENAAHVSSEKPDHIAHSSSVLGYVQRTEPSLTTERAFEQFLRQVAKCWWRGEGGADEKKRDVYSCFVGERILPLLACTRKDFQPSEDLDVDAATLRVVRDHDMALRCLFAAYCEASTEAVPLLGVLHFARDFRLLTAGRFPPAVVVDCARAARHARHPRAAPTSLRWPEFVESLLRLAQSSEGSDALADKTRRLLEVMDPTGRVFVRRNNEEPVSPRERRAETISDSDSITTGVASAPPGASYARVAADASQRRCLATRAAAAQCLAAATAATLQLATLENEAPELRAIADGMAVAARAAARRGGPPPALPSIKAPPSPEVSEREWPPPFTRSADELWRSPRGAASPPPTPPREVAAPFVASPTTVAAERGDALDAETVQDPWWWVDTVTSPDGAARHVSATSLQKLGRGFSLRRRLARLVAGVVNGAADDVVVPSADDVPPPPPDDEEAKEEPIPSELEVVARQHDNATEDERAVIHAFALAALLGDGSPRRIARARVLVETLKKLPDVEDGGEAVVAALERAGDLHVDGVKPTLEKLEVALRDSLSRVAVAEKFNPAAARDARQTAERLGAAVRRHPGFWARRSAADAAWEARERPANLDALMAMRKLVPRDVRNMRIEEVAAFLGGRVGLHSDDARLKPLAKRIVDQKILWLVHHEASRTAKTHVADLRSRYMYHDLDAVELRAVYACLPAGFEQDHDAAKAMWRRDVRRKLEESVKRAATGESRAGHPAYDVLSTATRPPTPPPAEVDSVEGSETSGPTTNLVSCKSAATLESALSFEELLTKQGPFKEDPPPADPPPTEPTWRECYDANYKRTYFFDVASGESRWKAPDESYVPYVQEAPARTQSVDAAALKLAAARLGPTRAAPSRSFSESALAPVISEGT